MDARPSFTPSFQHFQKDIERLLKSEGKCEKNERGQTVYRGYQAAVDRMFRVYIEREAFGPLVAEFRKWNWEWNYDAYLEELTARLKDGGDWPLLLDLWGAVIAKRRTNYNKTRTARKAVPDKVPEELVTKTANLLVDALHRLRSYASDLHKTSVVGAYLEMIASVEQRKKA